MGGFNNKLFSMRELQNDEPLEVRISALTLNLTRLTGEEMSENVVEKWKRYQIQSYFYDEMEKRAR